MATKSYEDLKVWQDAISLVLAVYEVTNNFPQTEVYGITNQIRRASVSIASNIAEGSERRGTKEFLHFLSIAKGSLGELNTQLIISFKLGFLKDIKYNELNNIIIEVGRMISGLQNKLKSKLAITSH